MARVVHKSLNVLRRWRAGLPVRGGVSPEVPDDLYQSLSALYVFAARFAAGRRVLVLKCGTGFGCVRLAAAGAAEVIGLDPDERSLAYGRKRFAGVRYLQGEVPPGELGSFGLIVAVDLLAHLQDPVSVLELAAGRLEPDGVFFASVPPIVDEPTMERNRASGLHRLSLFLWNWESLFRRRFSDVRIFGAFPPEGARLDLADPSPSRLDAEDFHFDEVPPARPAAAGTLSAVLVGRGQIL
ncbi:MAG TPA: class I SAM-dependent methyltransferase [Thermoanaerobaculia bacterium]|jgi:SAM-dependent methyltransferase|nr:class I SAM-dependent methyltransferase [Thermoanaerobaculia bacterium]